MDARATDRGGDEMATPRAMEGTRLCRSEARRDMEMPLNVFVGTWNLGNAAPDEEYFRDVLTVASEADILCLGFQEAHYSVKEALSFDRIMQLSSDLGRGSLASRKVRNAKWFRNLMKVRGCRRQETLYLSKEPTHAAGKVLTP